MDISKASSFVITGPVPGEMSVAGASSFTIVGPAPGEMSVSSFASFVIVATDTAVIPVVLGDTVTRTSDFFCMF